MYDTLVFNADSQAALAPWMEFYAFKGFWLVGVSLNAQSFTGSPTNANIDVNDDGAAIVAALAQTTGGTTVTWLAKDVGGNNSPVHVAAGSIVSIDMNFSGGTSPTVVDTAVVLMVRWDG
jgi:hypothetical protein